MVDGSSKTIDQIGVGDEVKNVEPESGITQRHAVTAIHITDDDHDFVDLTVATPAGPKTITATTHHRFWDATTHVWIDATDRRVGDQLSAPGDGQVVIHVLRRSTTTRTYNLTIDKVHTYYVMAGYTPVLVHNCDPVWTATKNKSFVENAYGHHVKHGGEFNDVQSWFDNPTSTTLSRTRTNGDVVRFDPATDYFGVMTKDGTPRTFFRPDPAQHGYPTNLDYFNAQ